jgi:O-antigen ligase
VTPWKAIALATLMTLILGGALPLFSFFLRGFTWLIWIAILLLIGLFSRELPVPRLMRPLLPYLLWLCFYLGWAAIVAPVPDFAFAAKVIVTTAILGACMAILTARPQYLRVWASAAQFAVVLNLLVLLLILGSAWFGNLLMAVTQRTDGFELGVSRFGGLWGNPNMSGYICLVATILSVVAVPWIAWLGRLSCLPLLWLSASRKSMLLYVLIFLLYLLIVQARNLRFWVASLTLVAAVTISLVLSDGLRARSKAAPGNATVARLVDLREADTSSRGGETRVDLLHHWTTLLAAEPWYGYGLKAMAGTLYDENDPEKVVTKGLFPLGTHNTYLGVLIEVGPIGFLAFVLVLLHYAWASLATRGSPITRWVLSSFLLCNLIILFVSHNHLFSFEGKLTFTLFFLLPTCLGLRELPLTRTSNR